MAHCIIVVALVAALPTGIAAQDCASYGSTSRFVGTVVLSPAPALCATDGVRLYTVGDGTLTVLDVSDPELPAPLGSLSGLGAVADLAVASGRVLLARGAAGLVLVDVSVPSAPSVAGSFVLPASVAAVGFAGPYVAAAGSGFFWLIDATTPTAMAVVGQIATITAADLAIVSDHALVTGQAGIASIALSVPAAPVQVGLFRDDVGQFSESGMYPEFDRIAVHGDRALVKSLQWEMCYDPMGGEYPCPAPFVVLLDVGDPASPVNVAGDRSAVEQLALAGNVAVATCQSRLRIFDGDTLEFLGQVRSPVTPGAVVLLGSRAYVGAGAAGLGVFDLTYAGTVLPLLTFGPGESHSASGRYDLGSTLSWSGHAASLVYNVYDVGDPLHPDQRLSGSLNGWMETPFIGIADAEGELLCLGMTDGAGPLVHMVYDMTHDPPRSAGVPFWNSVVDLIGNVAWVRTDDGNLVALGCGALPALPVLGQLAIGEVSFLAGSGAACLISWSPAYALRGLDLDDPVAPRAGGSVALPALASSARAIFGTRAYVVCGNTTLVIVELADPDHPAILGQATIAVATPRGLRLEDDLLAVLGNDGFQLVDASDPADPRAVSPVVGVPGIYGHAEIVGARLYAGHYYGLDVYDIEPPESPSLVGHGSGCGGAARPGAECIVIGGAIMPLECRYFVDVPDPRDPADAPPDMRYALRTAPNPFNPVSRVAFALPDDAAVELAVYDVRGTRLRTLATGRWAAGEHEIVWDGRDGRGAALASGPYLVRLVADGRTVRTAKVTLAR